VYHAKLPFLPRHAGHLRNPRLQAIYPDGLSGPEQLVAAAQRPGRSEYTPASVQRRCAALEETRPLGEHESLVQQAVLGERDVGPRTESAFDPHRPRRPYLLQA